MTEPTTLSEKPVPWWNRYPKGRARVVAVVVASMVAVGCSVVLGLRVTEDDSVAREVLHAGRFGGVLFGVQYAFGPKRALQVPVAVIAVFALAAMESVLRRLG